MTVQLPRQREAKMGHLSIEAFPFVQTSFLLLKPPETRPEAKL